jgi:hypothetical protein
MRLLDSLNRPFARQDDTSPLLRRNQSSNRPLATLDHPIIVTARLAPGAVLAWSASPVVADSGKTP